MPEPTTNSPWTTTKRVIPWAVFAVCLAAAVVSFFVFAHRVPSLMQALADR